MWNLDTSTLIQSVRGAAIPVGEEASIKLKAKSGVEVDEASDNSSSRMRGLTLCKREERGPT